MTTAQLIILCTAALALCAIAALTTIAVAAPSDHAARTFRVGDSVVVHTLDGRSIRGRVFAETRDGVQLTDSAHLTPAKEQPMAGVLHVPNRNIAFTQQLPADAPLALSKIA